VSGSALGLAVVTHLAIWVDTPGLPMGATLVESVTGVHRVLAIEATSDAVSVSLDMGTVDVRVGDEDWQPWHSVGELPDLTTATRLELSLSSEGEGRPIENTHVKVGLRMAQALDARAFADRDSGIAVAGVDLVHFVEGRADPTLLWVAIVASEDRLRTRGLAERGHPEIEIRGLGDDTEDAELVLRALVRSWLSEGRRVRPRHRVQVNGSSLPVRRSRQGSGPPLLWVEVPAPTHDS
jgi:hypothetical protein